MRYELEGSFVFGYKGILLFAKGQKIEFNLDNLLCGREIMSLLLQIMRRQKKTRCF